MRRLIPFVLVVAACSGSATAPRSSDPTTRVTTTTTSTTTTSTTITNPELPEPIFTVTADAFEADPSLSAYRSRARFVISTEPAGGGIVDLESTVDGAFLKEPVSVAATVVVNESLVVDVVGIGETYWLGEDGVWAEDPSARGLLGLAGGQLVDPDDLSAVSGTMRLAGVEEVNARPARRFVGTAPTIAALVARSDTSALPDLGRLDLADSEVWLDESGFILKARFSFGGVNELSGLASYYLVTIELYDFGATDIVIAPPA